MTNRTEVRRLSIFLERSTAPKRANRFVWRGVRPELIIGLAVLLLGWTAQAVQAKHPSRANRSNANASHSGGSHQARSNSAKTMHRSKSGSPDRQSISSRRAVDQSVAHRVAPRGSTRTSRYQHSASTGQRSKSVRTYNFQTGAANWNKGGGHATIRTDRNAQHATSRTRQWNAGANTLMQQPITVSHGNRTKTADVRQRLETGDRWNLPQMSGNRSHVVASPKHAPYKAVQPNLIRPNAGRSIHQPGSKTKGNRVATEHTKRMQFADRMKTGEIHGLTAGSKAKNVRLADQYRMYHRGDVARRLDLQKHGQHMAKARYGPAADRFHRDHSAGSGFHRGVVSPGYHRDCLRLHYWGPSFFVGVRWYPHWRPWVQWSWYARCDPYWDPRPLRCRPVIYDPCPVWGYWETPVWAPLPVVSCGTWVDLSPVVVADAEIDLQLLAVRFVDPGHPAENLGPRYRVWFRNNSDRAIRQSFDVMLLAAAGDALTAELPQAGVRVTAMEPSEMQSVDIRLPIEVYTMDRDADGIPVPFSTLHVLIDANREVPETDIDNNGAHVTPGEILPVDPAAFELEPTVVRPGDEVILAGEGFGPEPGQVLLSVGGAEFEGEILGWYDLGVRWSAPNLSVAIPTEAEVIVIRGDGAAANPLKMTIDP